MGTYAGEEEENIIESYFLELSCFNYDKAKELVEKEKEITKGGNTHRNGSAIWQYLTSALSQLATLEKNYSSLGFLTPKRFLRSDNSIKSQYESIKVELMKLDEISKNSNGSSNPNSSLKSTSASLKGLFAAAGNFVQVAPIEFDTESYLEKLLIHISGQLLSFVVARLEVIDFYEKLLLLSTNRFMNFEELLSDIKGITSKNQKQFHHPSLGHIKSVFGLETEILSLLIEAQVSISKWQFFPALMSLYESHCKLGTWSNKFHQREGKKLSFLKPTVMPALYQWLVKLKGNLLSKFTLYFHDVLIKQTSPPEMKSMCAKAPIDHHQKIISFQKKFDANYIYLILESSGDVEIYSGYKHPKRLIELPTGINRFPAIFSYPMKNKSHWPNLLMIMSKRSEELSSTDRVICFYDEQIKLTYFITRIEPGMTLVIIFESRKSEKDNNIVLFMQELTMQLRGNKLFTNLKPGSK